MRARIGGFVLILITASLLMSCRGFFQPDDSNNGGGGSGGGGGSTTAKFLYVTNSQSGSINAFTVGTNGALTAVAGSPFVGTTQPVDVAATPAGDVLFVADGGQGIWSFVINRNDGTLPAATTSLVQTNTAPVGVTSASANFAYGLEQGIPSQNVPGDVQPYNIISGALSPILGTAQLLQTNPRTVRIDPSGKFLYVAGDTSGTWIFAIQTANPAGTLTTVGQVATTAGTASRDVAIDPTTKFAFVANGSTGVETYTIGTDGNLTRTGGVTTAGTTPIRLAITPNGKFLYVINQGSNNISAYSVSTGTLTSLGTIATGSQPSAIAVDPGNAFVYVTNFVDGSLSVYNIGSTGALTANTTINVGAGPSAIAVLK